MPRRRSGGGYHAASRSTELRWTALLVLGVIGCSSEDSLGKKDGAQYATTTSRQNLCQLPDTTPPAAGSGGTAGVPDPSLVGHWAGSIDPSILLGSDPQYVSWPTPGAVRLSITEGSPGGVVVFGDAMPPEPPTEATSAYPPYTLEGAGGFGGFGPYEGFEYAVRDRAVNAERVHFTVASDELYSDWCPLQTSYSWAPEMPNVCGCLPNWGGGQDAQHDSFQEDPSTGIIVQRSAAQIGACVVRYDTQTPDENTVKSSPCICTAGGCTARLEGDVIFDLLRRENELEGTITILYPEDVQASKFVRFTRQ